MSPRSAPKKKAETIYTWVFKSSVPRSGGAVIDYVTELLEDKTLRCNCPGWVFCPTKNGSKKKCKHTSLVETESEKIFSGISSGQTYDIIDNGNSVGGYKQDPKSKPTVKFGRVVELQ